MMSFAVDFSARPLEGQCLYIEDEHSFDFLPAVGTQVDDRAGTSGTTSLAIGTLQVEVGVESGALLFVWGYLPRESWLIDSVSAPASVREGLVRVKDREPLQAGVSKALALHGEWPTHFDPSSGWVRMGEPTVDLSVSFASSTVAGFVKDRLTTLWLRPSDPANVTPNATRSAPL